MIDLLTAQHTIDARRISGTENAGAAQLTFAFGRHFGEDMALVLVLVLVASSRLFEAFCGSAVGFNFWHFSSPIVRVKKQE
jgi:hypothetical protein